MLKICSFRKDMTLKYFFLHHFHQMFNIAGPFEPLALDGTAGAVALAEGAIGQCTMDTFQVTGSGGASPVICGANNGQHSEFRDNLYIT